MRATRERPVTGRRKVARTVVTGGSVMAMGSASLLAGTTAPAAADHQEAAVTGVLNTTNWRICEVVPAPAVVTDTAIALWNLQPELNLVEACSSVNVWMESSPQPGTGYGVTYCLSWNAAGDCTVKDIYLDSTTLDAAPDPTWQWKKTATHELGHVGGLGHRTTNDSCMTQGPAPPITMLPDDHDYEAIEATYPR